MQVVPKQEGFAKIWRKIKKEIYRIPGNISQKSKSIKCGIYHGINNFIGNCYSLAGRETVRTYWYDGEINFGDLIGPELLRANGIYPIFRTRDSLNLEFVSVGSILDKLPNDYSGIIFGSGFIEGDTSKTFPHAKILAVRGKLTREKLGTGDNTALGDPGLIFCDIMSHRKSKKFELGLVAHFIDKKDLRVLQLRERLKDQVFFIDVQRKAIDVAMDIDQCKAILSSSLHGCIVADSLHIPNARVVFNTLRGGEYKFDDYYSVFDERREATHLYGNETLDDLLKLPIPTPKTVTILQARLREIIARIPEQLQYNRERQSRCK